MPPINISPEDLSLIESYLLQRMNETDRAAFEERILVDDDLAMKVDEVRLLITGIEEASLQSKLHSFHATMDGSGVQAIPLWRRWWAAACILVLAGGATWLLWPRGNANERLFATYFTADAGLPVAMGSADSASYVFYDGMVSYKEGQYAVAYTRWESLARSSGYTDTLRYYMGMALLNQSHFEQAGSMLLPLADNTASSFHDDAAWYVALIRLRAGDRAAAVTRLRLLTGRNEAVQLLKALD